MRPSQTRAGDVYRFSAESIDGKPVDLASYRGSVLLIVNVASRCGNTPQYADLQKIHDQYRQAGLVVLGFPANDFGLQEPGTNAEIRAFCQAQFGVTFPMFAKIHVKGPQQHPLYAWLTDPSIHPDTGGEIPWNFAKFLIGRDGRVVARFEPKTRPLDPQVVQAVQAALEAGG
ncbi:MAG: glutathione peroxidase [Planctomycetes bacterium]|nr:glutathione peroxidase [Planctomycetota bacterium]